MATIVFDTLGKLAFLLPRSFQQKRAIAKTSISSILVIRTAYIGDVVMTLPILKMLKSKYPEAKITFLTSKPAKAILENNPLIDELLIYDPFWFYDTTVGHWLQFVKNLRKLRFDLIIEARADIRDLLFLVFFIKAKLKVSYDIGGGSYLLTHIVPYHGVTHKVDYHINIGKYLGCPDDETDFAIHLLADEKQRADTLLVINYIRRPFVAIHPGSRLFLKRWPPERFAKICDYIVDTYHRSIVFIGASNEQPLVEAVQKEMVQTSYSLAGKINLRELAAVLERADLFICNDSAPMHIAAAMKTKTVAIFGPSKSIETGPYGNMHRVVEKEAQCRSSCDEGKCQSKPFHHCMLEIEVADVLKAVTELMVPQDDR